MQFDYFTFGGRFFWEDVYNYQNWKIQRNTRTRKYRLLDPHDIKRASGNFTACRNTLLKYIEAYELDAPFKDTVIVIHGFGRTRNSLKHITDSLKGIPANIIAFHYASLRKDLNAQAALLEQLLKNLETEGNLSFITVGAGCLVLRKMLSSTNNYRRYKIVRVLDINPINTGSDLAELLQEYGIFRFLLGPMLKDIATKNVRTLGKLPRDIAHGIAFCPSTISLAFKKMFSRYDSFPNLTPPNEQSFSRNIFPVTQPTLLPLKNPQLLEICRTYIGTNMADFSHDEIKK